MTSKEFIDVCKNEVAEYTNKHTDVTDHVPMMDMDDVYVV